MPNATRAIGAATWRRGLIPNIMLTGMLMPWFRYPHRRDSAPVPTVGRSAAAGLDSDDPTGTPAH
jgi:hypothetical protein